MEIEHNISERSETLKIPGLELSSETDVAEYFPGLTEKGSTRFFMNEKPITYWSFDPKTGKITIIDAEIAYLNPKFVKELMNENK